MQGASDENLVLASRSGDRTAYATLIERYRDLVFGVAYSGLGDFNRSEDIAQDTFVTAWEKKFNLAEPARIAGWLCGIARNLVRNERRKHAREVTADVAHQSATQSQSVEDQTIAAEEADFLWKVLEDIPETYREPMVLFYREEATTAEIAAALDVSEDVVRQRLSRGRKMLEKRVTELVVGTLGKRKTSQEFVGAVLLAIPAGVAPKAAGGLLGGIFSAAVFGPLIGVAGGILGAWCSLRNATSNVERRFMWQMIWFTIALVGALLTAQLTMQYWVPDGWSVVAHAIMWTVYSLLLVISIVLGNRRIRSIKQQHGTQAEQQQIVEPPKPVSAGLATWNLVGAIVGSTAWMVLVAAIRVDWLGVVLSVSLTAAVLAVYLPRFQTADTAAQQMRINYIACGVTLLGAIVITIARWNVWQLSEWM